MSNVVFPEPTYGFVGREQDIDEIEKRLTQRNVLLVHGRGGAGKTTLLRHLGARWQQSAAVERVFYFGYDEQAWTPLQILDHIAGQLLSDLELSEIFRPLDVGAQLAFITPRVRGQPHLLVLDNLESITCESLAIQNSLPETERRALQRLLADLVGGRTRILLGSRTSQAWLAPETFEDNVYELRGLDPAAATTLAERVLERHGVSVYRGDPNLERLLELLAGYPLALQAILENLARQTPTQVLYALLGDNESLSHASPSETARILASVDLTRGNLAPASQQTLLCLAPFSGEVNRQWIENYTHKLKQQPPLAQLPFENWVQVLQALTEWGLAERDPVFEFILHLEPALPYLLRERLSAPDQHEVKRAIETAFREYYDDIAGALAAAMDSADPKEKQSGQVLARLEYDNLYTALQLALDAQVSILNLYKALSFYLDAAQDQRRALELGRTVLAGLQKYPTENPGGQLGFEFVGVIEDFAKRQFLLKHYKRAEQTYQKALALVENASELDRTLRDKMTASVYHQLGRIAEAQRQWTRATDYYQQALEIKIDYDDLSAQARTYHQLGRVAQAQRQWAQAEQYYQQALEIFVQDADDYARAGTCHNLGTVAQVQQQWAQADHYYQQALAIYTAYNDRYAQARTYHQVGRLAQAQRQWAQAEQYYQRALESLIHHNDRYAQARIYHQLGRVAQAQRQWAQADHYYQQALQIKIEYNDRHAQARTYHNLGALAQAQRQWAQAEQYYQQSLQIEIEYDDRYAQADTYHNLGMVAQSQQQWAKAEQYYQRALQSLIDRNDRYLQADTYHNLGMVAQAQRRWAKAEQYYQQALQIKIENNDRYEQARTYHQLGRVAEEQQQWVQAHQHLLQALRLYVEYHDQHNGNIAFRSLTRLWKEIGDAALATAVAQALGMSLAELEGAFKERMRDDG